MREKFDAVMRFSGPRMLLHHPIWAIRHVVETKSEKRNWRADMKKENPIYRIGLCWFGLGCCRRSASSYACISILLLAAFCFAKSSEKLHNWFINTKLYKRTWNLL